jgi:hypothetical protein
MHVIAQITPMKDLKATKKEIVMFQVCKLF